MSDTVFCSCLNYASPARGGWSIVRTALLVPECYQLFIGAPACMRHIVLSSIELGVAERVSCLHLEEADVVLGSYEEQIYEGADELLDSLEPKPKVLMIFMTCIDSLLGTDPEAFLGPLNEKYRETRFIVARMNPIMADSLQPPGTAVQSTMYGLLRKNLQKENSVNFIGNNVAISDENEMIRYLKQNGIAVKHISQFDTFEGFQTMAQSRMNLVAAPVALPAAGELKERLGMEFADCIPCYSKAEILQEYRRVCEGLGLEMADFSREAEEAYQVLSEVATALKGRKVAIDYEATYRPFSMAKLLMEAGFAISRIYTDACASYEEEAFEWLKSRGVDVVVPNLYVKGRSWDEKEQTDVICIGFEAAYLEQSPYVVTLAADGELWGFEGIRLLAERLRAASEKKRSLEKLIDESVLII
ncbi:hypothetical protein D7Y05_06250 [bacterium 1XD42-54]|nr:hypothetical protein D7Y05_06250 [bacterium 1XD42-54]